ncbi:hypothetical protein [Ramlibacter tataouinensis]|uniref:Candidate membrane protein n=1 Tax=Ramlibacter tataouinensis (strain ATCC BAA-407 / DSM 14655 / LMG 21543 / TTB310) TaxID=365046 RepID=F5Y549_RAMTT|nr:hypothetical protein [Ramlibacter tataouinensis]AEG93889.1 candidate membrane protein [Ramlibacter tataouinensis TTB310]
MYSESDIDSAVAAGALGADAAAALRSHVARLRAAPAADEEQFRLVTGFNDVFVSIAVALMLLSLWWLVGRWPGALAVAAAAWGLAEYFTRRRRMALPSILLHLAFILAVSFAVFGALAPWWDDDKANGWRVGAAAAAAAAASVAHWRRFQVPITVAVMLGSALAAVVTFALIAVPALRAYTGWMAFAAGGIAFAVAMAWDMSDPLRRTRRADVAFWLHLLASPLLVHSIFTLTGLTGGSGGIGHALAVLAGYVLLVGVALVVDRRAMMVSALAYVLIALSSLFREFGIVQASMGLTALLISSALLLLSAAWAQVRARLVSRLPDAWQARLPPAI